LILDDKKGWQATFNSTGLEHLPTSATGTGWERTPWHATQRAAWEARGLCLSELIVLAPLFQRRITSGLTAGAIR
jgi:hypothetical protein